jgi:hypothetical protein
VRKTRVATHISQKKEIVGHPPLAFAIAEGDGSPLHGKNFADPREPVMRVTEMNTVALVV